MREPRRDIARWAWFLPTDSEFQGQLIFYMGRFAVAGAPIVFLAWPRRCCRLRRLPMAEKKANFVPVSALDKRRPSKRDLLRGLVRQAPFVAKNFQLYFRNAWRRHILRTKVVAPYAVTFYVTHKCNLACSYCTQKEPDVFSDELPTLETIQLLKRIRKETDSIVITGGEPTLRADIEELVEAARFECRYRSLLLITNGTLLDRKPRILRAVTGLVVSLDALAADPTNPLSKLALLQNPKYQALVDKIIERRRKGAQPINGTPRTIETLLRFGDFQCYPTMFPRVYPNGDVFYPCEPLRKVAGNLLRDGSLRKIFARGKKIYGDIPPCQGICYLFGNVLSHYYVNDFWGLAGDFIR